MENRTATGITRDTATDDHLQRQARALGDPTRLSIFRRILESVEPVTVAELTRHAGVHHNAVRQHLQILVDAGMVRGGTAAPSGRGRPKLVYTVDAAAAGRWGGPDPYEELSVMLAEVIRTGDDPVEVGRRWAMQRSVGAPPGRPDAGSATTGADRAARLDALLADFTRRGFEPRPVGDDTVVLDRCPFRAAASTDPDTVCGLHLGLARGVAEATGVEVESLRPYDPAHAGCRLVLAPDADHRDADHRGGPAGR